MVSPEKTSRYSNEYHMFNAVIVFSAIERFTLVLCSAVSEISDALISPSVNFFHSVSITQLI